MNTGASWPTPEQARVRVLGIQTKLHQRAKADAQRRFDDLFNLVCDPAFLAVAWGRVRGNRGARTAGVDGETAYYVETVRGAKRFLEELCAELKARRFTPLPVRERLIPKRSGKLRRLGIAAVRDRVVQAALKLVLEPIWEADFHPSSYGFRPKRRVHDAIAEMHLLMSRSYEWALEADIEACFDEISHSALTARVRQRVGDKRVLALVKAFLKAGILTEDGQRRDTVTGTPQGGILSPVLANVALSVLDEHFAERWPAASHARQARRRKGLANYRLVRYADDFVVLVAGDRAHAEQVREDAAAVLAPIGLRLSADKTAVRHIDEGLGRAGARCRRCRRSVSPTRPPNRACRFLGTRLSTGWALADQCCWLRNDGSGPTGGSGRSGGRPGRGDTVTAIAVSGDRDLRRPGESCAVGAGPVAPPVSSPDLFPGQPRVFLAQPPHHSPPQVVAEVGEAALAGGVAMVVGPTPKDRVERVDQLVECEIRRVASGQLFDAVGDVAQCSVAGEAVGHRRPAGSGTPHDAESQQVEAVVDVGDACLVRRERQAHVLCHELGRFGFEGAGLRLGAAYQHHEVVRVADHPVAGQSVGSVTRPLVVRTRGPCLLEAAVEYRQGDVREQGRKHPSLRRARWRGGHGFMLAHDPGAEEAPDQSEHALVGDPTTQLGHEQSVVDAAEAVFDVSLDHPLIVARGVDEEPHLFDGVLCPAAGPEPVRGRTIVGLVDRFQHQHQRHLDDPVAQGGNAKRSDLARSSLGDLLLTHRQWRVGAALERLSKLAQELLHAIVFDACACHAINTGGARPPVAFHPLPRDEQRRGVTDEVEQISEPLLLVLDGPTVQLGLPPQYPLSGLLGLQRRGRIHARPPKRRIALRSCCPPSPCGRLPVLRGGSLLPRLLRGLRHAHRASAGIGPSRAATSGSARSGRFPRSL